MYSVIVVDDEEIARLRLRRLLLENFGDFKIVAEVANGNAAAEIIRTTKPDLVFLDIEMPGISGVEIARTYCEDIFVVFITAHNQYVFDAFKTLAVAYILKPLELEELREAIGKFKKIVTPAISKTVAGPAVKQDFPSVRSEHIKVSIGNTTKFILFNDIIYFEASQKYTITFTSDLKNYIVDRTLLELEDASWGRIYPYSPKVHCK
ncbi:MAG: response regulator [Chitinispirillaceae bacterium]|nr:response regulator [Chitinispirillaceae bacterium]